MKRSWLKFVAGFVFATFGAVCGSAFAHGGGGGGGGFHGGGMSHAPSFSPVRQASFNGPIHNVSPVKVGKPITGGGLTPVTPVGPIKPPGGVVGPIKPPGGVVGPITPPIGPVGPVKPPIGPVGPVKPPIGPVGPVKPLPPVGPVGPVKPPVGPVGPVKPPVGPVGPVKPPVGPGPVTPPGGGTGGGTGGGATGTGHGHGHHGFGPIVLGLLPIGGFGGSYGGYYPPVYTQPVTVPVATPVAVPSPVAIAETPVETTAVAAASSPAIETTPALTADKLPQVPVGSTLKLQGKDLGSKVGQVLLVLDTVTIGVPVNEWNDDYATATLPLIGVTGLTKSEIVLVKADGQAASKVDVALVPAQQNGG